MSASAEAGRVRRPNDLLDSRVIECRTRGVFFESAGFSCRRSCEPMLGSNGRGAAVYVVVACSTGRVSTAFTSRTAWGNLEPTCVAPYGLG